MDEKIVWIDVRQTGFAEAAAKVEDVRRMSSYACTGSVFIAMQLMRFL
jgi:hypothetical protein